ncbi:uncharacterized protein (DUF736 family) [Bradyrhizobium elkanii]|nr:uncharacterized protein (DUF736 family) [Bradyrhizobium elkanii]
MATIGTFTASDNGYIGSIKTLTLNIKARFAVSEKDNDKAPDYRIFAGVTEFGAAWKKTARDSDREYLSVKLDDPSFPAPIYASLVKVDGDEGFTLIWSRRNGDRSHRDHQPRLLGGGAFCFSCAALQEEEHFFFEEIAKGSALARARVKHTSCAGRSGIPGLPRKSSS